VSAAEVLHALGGLAARQALIDKTSRADVDRALRRGDIVVVARGRYALPSVAGASAVAHALSGVLSHTSAALHHGWEVKAPPEKPHVMVPRKRRVSAEARRVAEVHFGDLFAEDVADGIATGVELTLIHCLRALPDDEALAVADSGLRHGVPPATLRRVAMAVTGPGSAKVRRIAGQARAEAANPFESCLRSIALTVSGLSVQPQVWLPGLHMRSDLVDRDRKVVLEADSFEWHGDRAALRRDARRYNAMVVDGWLVLRFAWEDVMFHPEYVREVLVGVAELVHRQAQPCCLHRCAA
jgi:very-short-patch-repair endonuclease